MGSKSDSVVSLVFVCLLLSPVESSGENPNVLAVLPSSHDFYSSRDINIVDTSKWELGEDTLWTRIIVIAQSRTTTIRCCARNKAVVEVMILITTNKVKCPGSRIRNPEGGYMDFERCCVQNWYSEWGERKCQLRNCDEFVELQLTGDYYKPLLPGTSGHWHRRTTAWTHLINSTITAGATISRASITGGWARIIETFSQEAWIWLLRNFSTIRFPIKLDSISGWQSVAFAGIYGYAIAVAWVALGLFLLLFICCRVCFSAETKSGSKWPHSRHWLPPVVVVVVVFLSVIAV